MKKRIIIIVICISVFIIGILCGFVLSKFKSNDVNAKELIEDINSIINDGTIINAKEKEPYSIPSTYYGKGYYITVSLGGDCTEYFIYSNNEEVWRYTKIYKQETIYDYKKGIELKKESETYNVDSFLTMNFLGEEDLRDGGGPYSYYKYTASISLNGKPIDNQLFSDENNKVIWSSNYGATFNVEKINNLYTIISSIAKQNDGDYVLIINTNGQIVNTFNDVNFMLDKENNRIVVSDCKTNAVDEACSTKEYQILENGISN